MSTPTPHPVIETCATTGQRFHVLPIGDTIRETDHCTLAEMPPGSFIRPVQCHGFTIPPTSGLRYLRPLDLTAHSVTH